MPLNFQEWAEYVSYNGFNYPFAGMTQTLQGQNVEIGSDYLGLAEAAFRGNAVVFACMLVRLRHFTEARFQWRDTRNGKLFGSPELAILETPWANATTGTLLGKMIQHVDLHGNSYVVREGGRLAVLPPDWVDIMVGSRSGRTDWVLGDGDTEVLGYVYWPGGRHSGNEPTVYTASEVAHWAPIPDPIANYRGMSWLTPLIREVQGDGAMTQHKLNFLKNGATVNLVVKFATPKQEDFNEAVAKFRENHEGLANAYKTLFLGAGTDVQPVGTDLAQMDFTSVQSAGELRIASAAQVPPVILGLREGLSGSTLNSGNFQQSRRMLSDTMRSLWREASGALQTILTVPGGSELWYDERGISFLKDDLADIANVQALQAEAYSKAFMAGVEPNSIIAWLASDDITKLVPTDATSVQTQGGAPVNGAAPTNGVAKTPPLPVVP